MDNNLNDGEIVLQCLLIPFSLTSTFKSANRYSWMYEKFIILWHYLLRRVIIASKLCC